MTTRKNTKNTAPKKGRNTFNKRPNKDGTIFYDDKREKWIAQITVGHHPKTGRRIYKTRVARTQREALEALEELKTKYAAVTHVEAGKITFGDWLNKWYVVYIEPRIRENTRQDYRRVLALAKEELGDILLDKLTDIDLQGVIFGRLGKHYRTAKYFRVLMRAALRRAVRSHLLKESPAEDLELPPKPDKRPFVKPSEDDWLRLLNYPTCYYCWKWIILTEYVTGCRLSELLALKWEDLTYTYGENGTLTGGVLHIGHALIRGENEEKGGERPLIRSQTKTESGNRYLNLPADFCREMKELHKLQLERRLMFPGMKDDGYIFTKDEGQPINPASFSSRFCWVRKRLGIGTTFHMLRHDMAVRMKKNHFDAKDAQFQLGHSTIQTTLNIYTHLDRDDKNAIGNWLQEGVSTLLTGQENARNRRSS